MAGTPGNDVEKTTRGTTLSLARPSITLVSHSVTFGASARSTCPGTPAAVFVTRNTPSTTSAPASVTSQPDKVSASKSSRKPAPPAPTTTSIRCSAESPPGSVAVTVTAVDPSATALIVTLRL